MKEKIQSSRFYRFFADLSISRKLAAHPLIGKIYNYEMIAYVICGAMTTLVNYLVYFLMPRFGTNGLDLILANSVAWIAAVIFAYFVNKVFVFDSPSFDRRTVKREFYPFVTCRLLSLGLETLIIYIFAAKLSWNETAVKIVGSIFVLLINYFASKFLIFKKQ